MNKEFKILMIGFIIGGTLSFLINYWQIGCSPWDPRCCKKLESNPCTPSPFTIEE